MILLRRLHIINWMYYSIQTIDLQNSNLLSGPTGSGKSSIVDALQVILLGDISSRYFNRSATGNKSDRNIVTYLRGRFSDNEYKRKDKAFSSYIVADYYDERNREEFCYGVVFDLTEDNTHDKDYFHIEKEFRLDWATIEKNGRKVALSRKEFKSEMRTQGIPLRLFTPNEYKNHLLIRLGIYDEHFFQIFRTAVAYVPLDKIEDFIVKNICHMEDNIDVPKMRSAIHEYQRMQLDMSDFLERQRKLTEINSIYDEFSSRLDTYNTQEYIVSRAQVDCLREEQLTAEKEMGKLEDERETCEREEGELETLRAEKTGQQIELIKLLNDDPENRRKEELKSKLEVCNKSIKEKEEQRDNYALLLGQRLTAWKHRLHELSEKAISDNFDTVELDWLQKSLELHHKCTREAFSDLDLAALGEMSLRLEQLRKNAFMKQSNLKSLYNEADFRSKEYVLQLDALREGVKSYPKDLLALKAYIQDTLTEDHGVEVTVFILADLLTITDPVWVNVTEGYLRRQKLYLLTEPEYYREALRIFKKYSRENRCYLYRIVNTESILIENIDVLDNSLAMVIETEHPAAGKYIDFLLGRVERVDSIENIGGKRSAVTADGMLYSSFTAARMNEDDWRMKYIGQASIALQIEEISRLLENEIIIMKSLNPMIEHLQPCVNEKALSDEFMQNLEIAVAGTLELPALSMECDMLWTQLQSIDDSYSKKLEKEKKQVENELANLLISIKQLNHRNGELSAQHNALYILGGEKEEAWKEEYKRFSAMYPEGNDIAERTAMRYDSELAQKESAAKLHFDFDRAFSQTKIRLDTLKQNFRDSVEEFNRKHTASSISTDISSNEWRKAYDEVSSVQLETYTSHVTVARNRAEEMFHNEFINQIKGNIDTVKREINLLNLALGEYRFGKVKYRFKCVPTENPEMRRYYDMITNLRLDGYSIYDLMEPGADLSEYEPMVKTLFQLIASEGTDAVSRKQVDENIEKFKSFQTYLHFDLVEVGENGKEYPLSRSMGSKSGGERQTPFYIAILASLVKTYKVNHDANSLRLVVFDEAFDKIDTSRIEECINMLRDIGFQFIIAAPDNKAPYIAPLVERTMVVIKPDDMTSVVKLHHKDLGVPV